MKLINMILAGSLLLGLSACSSDEPQNVPSTEGDGNAVYSTLRFRMPASRADGKNDGVEIGQDNENNIGSILVVIAAGKDAAGQAITEEPATGVAPASYELLTYSLNDAPTATASGNDVKYTLAFEQKEELLKHAGEFVYIFAYCNPTEEIRAYIEGLGAATDKDFKDKAFAGDPSTTWKANGFLMTNVKLASKKLPSQAEMEAANKPGDQAIDLGVVSVVRTASRFDFRDASAAKNLSYDIMHPEIADKKMGSVTLTRVALFNLRKDFYYLPRTKATADAAEVTYCPGFDEMDEGYVVSPAKVASNFTDALPEAIDPTNPAAAGLTWTDLASLTTEDKDEGWGTETTVKEGYHIWRYATENTWVGEDDIDYNQTTGYVFEAKMTLAEQDKIEKVDGKNQPVYVYGGVLYYSPADIALAIEKSPISKLATDFAACWTAVKGDDGKYTCTAVEGADPAQHNFTVYPANDKGEYLCYYFAYNRHNDNGKPSVIGPMEFGTVRNNVYKLAVTNITQFGDFKPETNVETWDVFFKLEVLVRPWMVRINNIEF